MELQDIQNNWNNQFDTKGNNPNLVLQLFKESRQNKVRSKLTKVIIYTLLYMLFNLTIIVYSWMYIANHFPKLGVLVPGSILLILSYTAFFMNVFQLNDLAKIKFDTPIVELQKIIEKLKIKRIKHNRFIFIFSNIYFWMMVMLIFSFDLFELLSAVWENAPYVVIFHFCFSTLWFPIAFYLLKKYNSPLGHSKFWNRMKKDSYLTDQSVNESLNSALGFVREIEAFEKG